MTDPRLSHARSHGTDPGPTGPDDTTGPTLAYLREARRGHRRARLRDLAFWCYTALLILGLYGGASGAYLNGSAAVAVPLLATLPAGLSALFLLVLVIAAHDATWRGPIGLDVAATTWLLPLPIRRERLLRPRMWTVIAGLAAAGAGGGAIGGSALHVTGLGAMATTIPAGSAAGLLLMTLAGAAGMLIQRFPRLTRPTRRGVFPAVLAVLALGTISVAAALGHGMEWLDTILLWSGPWGWAAQPLVAAAGGTAPAWSAAVLLLAAADALALHAAARTVAGFPGAALRSRAQLVRSVTSAISAIQPRQASLAIRAAGGPDRPRRFRLPAPHHRSVILAWRDATALLQQPRRVAIGLAWFAGAYGLAVLGTGSGSVMLTVLVAAVGYLAAAQLVEPARLDADNPQRSRALPYRYRWVAVYHAVVPIALLLLAGATATVVLGVVGVPTVAGLALTTATPALVGAALASAYRGVLSEGLLLQLSFGGLDTPLGDPTPFIVAVWYASAVLAAITLLVPPLHWMLQPAGPAPGLLSAAITWCAATAALMLAWAGRRANRWYRANTRNPE